MEGSCGGGGGGPGASTMLIVSLIVSPDKYYLIFLICFFVETLSSVAASFAGPENFKSENVTEFNLTEIESTSSTWRV